jgi:peptidoglycan/LPS O-acetylase OafA/YrhL
MVLVGHVLGGYNNQYLAGTNDWLAAINRVGTFGVEVFFVLSGYVILNSIRTLDVREFAQHRFWRIYPVFLCFTLLYFVGNRALRIDPETDSVAYLLINLSFLDIYLKTPHLTPNAWTITYEIWFYLLSFALLKPLLVSKYRFVTALTSVLCLAFAVLFPLTMYFAAGMVINVLESRTRMILDKVPTIAVGILEIAAIGGLIYVLAQAKLKYTWIEIFSQWRFGVVFALTLLLFVLVLSRNSFLGRLLRRKELLAAGTISYSLYLSHPYPYFLLKRLIGGLSYEWVPTTVSVLMFLSLVVIVSIPFAYLVHRFIEIAPYRFMTGRVIYARQ